MKKPSLILAIIMMLLGLLIISSNAETYYNAQAAVNYALAHTGNNEDSECTQFITKCLEAGGIYGVSGNVETEHTRLLPYGTQYQVFPRKIYSNESHLYTQDCQGDISLGDIVYFYCNTCPTCPYAHTAIITKIDPDGKIYYSQHNSNIQNNDNWAFSHPGTLGSYHYTDVFYIIHLNSTPDTEIPQITGAITQCSTTGYEVTCTASDNQGIAQLAIGTWNDAIGVGSAQWQTFDIYGKNVSHTFKINIADFGNRQNTIYHSNVYAYDVNGNPSQPFRAADILIETEKPIVTEARVENITKTSYDVVCKATDNGTIHRFIIGTWHDNMSVDDAVWQTSDTFVNEARFTVNVSSFGNAQNVIYHTNVYAIDLCGNYSQSARAGNPFIETTAPSVTQCDAINISDTGYDVVVTATDNSCLKKLQIGTWHSGIPVEQAQWQEVNTDQQGNYTHTFHIDIADFENAQNVIYYTNAYAIDLCGNVSAALMSQYVPINEKLKPDFILPAGTVIVEEYAFQGCAFTYVRLSDETTTLCDGAFADCPKLKHVYMPEKTENIGNDVFPDGITIHGKLDSYAKTYADLHKYHFVEE